MKLHFTHLLYLILINLYLSLNAQIPKINSNVSGTDIQNDVVNNYLNEHYDFAIKTYTNSGWYLGDKDFFSAIAVKNRKWVKLQIVTPRKNHNVIEKIEAVKINRKECIALIEKLTSNNFWSLSNDSLNIREIAPKFSSHKLS